MKTLTALCTVAALMLTAGMAQADVRADQIPQLVKECGFHGHPATYSMNIRPLTPR